MVAKKGAGVVPKENVLPCLIACVDVVAVDVGDVVGVVVVAVVALVGDSVNAVENNLNVNLDTREEGVGEKAGVGVGVCGIL